MSDPAVNPLDDPDTDAARAYAEERRESIRTFVRTNPDYYIRNFDKIGESSRFTATFNIMAGLFGPVWYGARGLWSWALPFLIIETLALVQIARGLFGDLAADARARIASIEGTLDLRREQLAAAIETNSDKIDVYQRTVDSLEANIGGIRDEADALAEQGTTIALTGLILLLVVKAVQAVVANWALETRFSEWTSDQNRTIRHARHPDHFQRRIHGADRAGGDVPLQLSGPVRAAVRLPDRPRYPADRHPLGRRFHRLLRAQQRGVFRRHHLWHPHAAGHA